MREVDRGFDVKKFHAINQEQTSPINSSRGLLIGFEVTVHRHLDSHQYSRIFCEPFDASLRLTQQPAGKRRLYNIQIRSFSSMFFLRSSFISKSLGTGSYVDQSARFHNETALSTQILRL